MVLILAAMEGEISGVVARTENPRQGELLGYPYWEGVYQDHPVVFGITGAGKSLASLMTGRYLALFSPDEVIFIGIAGALNPLYRPGDLLLVRDCLHYDIDLSPLNLPVGQIPGRKERIFPANAQLLKAAAGYRPKGFRLWTGRVLTGDGFVTEDRPLFHSLEGDAVDMEGASAALAAHLSGTPFLMVRMISDRVGQSGGVSGLGRMMRRAGERCGDILDHIFRSSNNMGEALLKID